jgi:hypothetical protein
MRPLKHAAHLLALLLLSCSVGAQAQFLESWKVPALAAGSTTATLPAGWRLFFPYGGLDKVEYPNTVAAFNAVEALSGPADGSQFLSLTGTNTGVARMSGLFIQPGMVYTLAAAIGNSKLLNNYSAGASYYENVSV